MPKKTDPISDQVLDANPGTRVVESLLKPSESLSIENPDSSGSDDDSDSGVEEDVLVMEMEPSPRPLSLASSKKLSELCDYVSDDEASFILPPLSLSITRSSLSMTMA